MRARTAAALATALGALATLAAGCSSGSQIFLASSGLSLTVNGDSTFAGADGGRRITVALVRGGAVEQEATDTVASTASPAFSFRFPGALLEGESYDLDYWIDTNKGGGTAGTCDPPPLDQTWQVPVDSVASSVSLSLSYDPSLERDVCGVFNK